MSFATTATPGGFSLGTEDKSRVRIPADPVVESMTNPFIPILAERGRGDATYCTTAINNLYGDATFKKGSPFYHHSNAFLSRLSLLGIPCTVKRFIPDQAKKAMIRLSLELITTNLPEYERSSDGSIKYITDPVTGLSKPVVKGTIRGTRGVIHVGTSQYLEENREFKMGNVREDYRDGSTTINGVVLGEITLDDGTKEYTKSRLYPIMDVLVDSEGEYGNNVGLILEVPHTKQVAPVNINNMVRNKAFSIRVGVVERTDKHSSPYPRPKLDGDNTEDMQFKAKAQDYISGASLNIAERLVKAYSAPPTQISVPEWGPFGDVHVYDKNINEVQAILAGGSIITDVNGNDVDVAGEADFDDMMFEYGRTADFKFSDSTNNGLLNFLTGRDFNNVPYPSYSVSDSILFGGITINNSTVIYGEGGDDGLWYLSDGSPAELVNLKMLDEMYRAYLKNFGLDPVDKLLDVLRYPITAFVDTGWSLDTKLAHANVLKRPDVVVFLGTQSVVDRGLLDNDIGPLYRNTNNGLGHVDSTDLTDRWDFQEKLTPDQDAAIALKLRTFFGLHKESVFFGTPVMRVLTFGEVAYDSNDLYDHPLPGSYDRGLAICEYTGVTSWNDAVDFTENDFRKPRFLKNFEYRYRNETTADSHWDVGLNFLRAHDKIDFFWPAIQSIYPHKDSILNSAKFILAAARCHYYGMIAWRDTSGENKTDEQYKQDLETAAREAYTGRFPSGVYVDVEAVLTDADKARGYSGYLKFTVAVGSPRTKLTYSVHGYKLDQIQGNQ